MMTEARAELIDVSLEGTPLRLFDHVDLHASTRPTAVALIEANTEEAVSWKDLSVRSSAFAARLLAAGLGKGDVVATMLPTIKEHLFLAVACWRLGCVFAPLDLRLKTRELEHAFSLCRPKAFFFVGKTPIVDMRPVVAPLLETHAGTAPGRCTLWVQFQKERELVLQHPLVMGVGDFAASIKLQYVARWATGQLWWKSWWVGADDPAAIIFTTGSTGMPKPAVLSQHSMIAQAMLVHRGFHWGMEDTIVCNFPLSHVAALSEFLATWLLTGGKIISLPIFNAEATLKAIEKYHVSFLAQIPAMFNLLWRCPNFASFDLSSLKCVGFGGQAVNSEFVSKLSRMAPNVFTGFGLTETSGICSCIFVPAEEAGKLTDQLGACSSIAPITIRGSMQEDGRAGAVLAKGEIGSICLEGQQRFLGYMGLPEETSKTISSDGVLYTGDLGVIDPVRGLLFVCRSKHICKPKGHQVFPPEIEDFVMKGLSGCATNAALVGMPHSIFSDGLVLFLEPAASEDGQPRLTPQEVDAVCAQLPSFKRPLHTEILEPGGMPLNRVAKTDYLALQERAASIIEQLRSDGKWDAC